MTDSHIDFSLLLGQVREFQDDRVYRCVTSQEQGLCLGVDKQEHRHIMATVARDYAFREYQGDSLRLTEWWDGEVRFIDLECTETSLSQVFAGLADDVIRRVERGAESAQALLAALGEWRKLFRPFPAMTEEAARGLFGELYILKELARRNPFYAVESWVGPLGNRHDFETPNGDVEVKTSQREGLDVVISSLGQLDPPSVGDLWLVRIRVETNPHGRSLGEVVEELARCGVPREDLVPRIAEAGFHVDLDPDEHRFEVIGDPHAWMVDSEFPGLRSADIPESRLSAITSVKYTLDLVAATRAVSISEMTQHLDKMMAV